jgi:RHS repeat-associated protein
MMRRRTAKSQGGVSENYSFDAIDQVTGANYGGARNVSYNYDSVGNRTSVIDNAVTTNYSTNNLNQYTNVGGIAHGSDANGNLVSGQGIFLYDSYNRLTQAVVGANTVQLTYDSKNRVVKRTINGVPLFLIYDGWSLIEERDASGTVLQKYVNGSSIDEVLVKINSSGSVYYHQDGLGSVTQLTDLSGNVVEKYAYDIFGKASIFGGLNLQAIASSLQSNRFLFTGREWLSDVGLYDYRNRVYSCELGRFLQTDPIRFSAGDVNLYRYVRNGSTRMIDSLGLCCEVEKAAVAAAEGIMSGLKLMVDSAESKLDPAFQRGTRFSLLKS